MHCCQELLARLCLVVSCGWVLWFSHACTGPSDQEIKPLIETHSIESPYQSHETSLRVLLPNGLDLSKRYPVLYVLPVHEDGSQKHGDGLMEIAKLNVADRYQVICVAPSFSSEPWYADHDQNPNKRDESHLMKTVMPFIESHYPTERDRGARYLIGFSKSGWGAISLLLRHPETFHKIAAWDPGIRIDMGPMDEDTDDQIQTGFGSRENFENYRLSNLFEESGSRLGPEVRLFYFNCDGVKRTAGGARLHSLMIRENIPHRYVMESNRDHRWDSGWVTEAIAFLFKTP